MAAYDLYGLRLDDISQARDLLENCLGLQFQSRESDYQGGIYFKCGKNSGEHFVLKNNIDLVDGEVAEIEFPSHRILFYINDTARSSDLQKILNQKTFCLDLLRHEELT
jgi:hypothetical protein